MQFNSYIFILLFLPLTILGYFLISRFFGMKAGNVLLVAASLWYYSYAGWQCMLILLGSVLVNYLFLLLMRRHRKSRALLTVSICANVLLLLYFKYCNFFISNVNALLKTDIGLQNIILPLGISFFTFQQISFLVGTYRETMENCSFLEYAAYILYFPKLVMGPLIEPDVFLKQLRDESLRKVNTDHLAQGVQMFALGLFKKVILADTFAKAVNWGFANFAEAGSLDWFLIMIFYSFQIYFDFSGYTDMAMAASRMLNLELPQNFNSPYQAYSLRDFWKRWHMTLTNFLTRYIYIPLGGSRAGRVRTYVNMIIVFLVSGIWHGANWTFILWGLLNGLICVIERLQNDRLEKLHTGARWLGTFAIVNVLWLLFRAESVGQWIDILKKIVSLKGTGISEGLLNSFVLPVYPFFAEHLPILAWLDTAIRGLPMLVFLIAGCGITFLMKNNCERTYKYNIWTVLGTVLLLFWCIISLAGESVFVYFGF